MTFRIKVDYKELNKDLGQYINIKYPRAAANAMDLIAKRVQQSVRGQTKTKFDLSTQWIPKNIQRFPQTPGHKKKLESDIKRNDFFVTVYTHERINFMVGHEQGTTRKNTEPGGKYLALPSRDLKKKPYRSKSGPVKNAWSPKILLQDYKKHGSIRGNPGDRGKNTGRASQRKPFLMEALSGHLMIMRRTSKKAKPYEPVYHFKRSAKIKQRWFFEDTGKQTVNSVYRKAFRQQIRKLNK